MRPLPLLLVLLPLLFACTTTLTPKTVFVVRHGEKISGERDADLSVTGKLRAARLAQVLEKEKLSRVFSTNFKRTRDTVAPTAASHGLKVENYDDSKQLIKQIKKSKGSVLVAGHSNTLPEIVELLSGDKQTDIDDLDYSNLFVVFLSENASQVAHLTY